MFQMMSAGYRRSAPLERMDGKPALLLQTALCEWLKQIGDGTKGRPRNGNKQPGE